MSHKTRQFTWHAGSKNSGCRQKSLAAHHAPALLASRRRGSRRQAGVAAVEFAFILPLLLLIVFGTVEFGIALYDKAVITNASREGARAGIVLKSPKPTSTDIQNVVQNYTSSYLVTFGTPSTPTVTPTGQGGAFGTPLSVTVSYQYAGLGLGTMLSALTGPITLSATTVMNNE
ncbi:TadE/TadG family type IV pilus assembly protein (plasmid) [Paraburkholderia sp. DD10]|uniref:TadE/TadG family type IV pilus assembly protein n=1 Tax=Paraburkholderia sp. DD10 TaxID=3409691 RepID=UPI003BA1A122